MRTPILVWFLLAAGLAGCADSIIKPLGPENSEQIDNQPDTFRFQAVDLDNVHDTRQFTWTNTGTQAAVLHRNFIHHGTVVLMVRDALGRWSIRSRWSTGSTPRPMWASQAAGSSSCASTEPGDGWTSRCSGWNLPHKPGEDRRRQTRDRRGRAKKGESGENHPCLPLACPRPSSPVLWSISPWAAAAAAGSACEARPPRPGQRRRSAPGPTPDWWFHSGRPIRACFP